MMPTSRESSSSLSVPPLRRMLRIALVCLILPMLAVPGTPLPTLAQATGPQVSLTTSLIEPTTGQAEKGKPVTFRVTLANTGSTVIDVLPLGDTFDPVYLQFASATVGGIAATPDVQSTNVISWTDLTLLPQVGNLAIGASVAVDITFTALEVTTFGGGVSPTTPSGPPGSPEPGTTVIGQTPHDFYDKETRFLIDHAIDGTNGGVYLAVKGDGTLWDAIPDRVYGFAPNFFAGSAKHPGGQALCVEYFIREYQRLSDTARTIATTTHGVQKASDMLGWAKNCADFVNDHMIIGKGQNEPQPLPSCPLVYVDGNKCVYYWGFVNAAGTGGQMLPIGTGASYSAPNSHHLTDSFVAWKQAELARILRSVGDPSYITYKDAAYGFFTWAQTVGPPYDLTSTPQNPSYGGRDTFWSGLLMTLYDLSVDEGQPNQALRNEVLDCINQKNAYAASANLRSRCNGTSYSTAYGRSASHALEVQERGIDNYYVAGSKIVWHDFGDNRYADDPATPNNPTIPFAHGSGREMVAGNQRAHWFYYTFPNDANLGRNQVPAGWTVESWSKNAVLGYWNYSIQNMWDATPGQEAWWDAKLTPGKEGYKPCFSLGTPVPIADWRAPAIGNKIHTLNPDGSATVTVSGVQDEDWPYATWKFKGIGMKAVRVFYSVDDGATWTGIDAILSAPGIYVATIPPQTGKSVRYYAEAEDAFGNISTFPSNAPQVYQIYTLENVTFNLAWSVAGSDTLGNRVQGDSTSTKINIITPSAVTLSQLEAHTESDGVRINWQTSSEQDSYGFNVYRGSAPDRSDAVRLNETTIASRGAGTSYSFLDNRPLADARYYWLEEVDLAGRSNWYRVRVSASSSTTYKTLLPFIKR